MANSEMLYHVHRYVIPAALSLLPGRMTSPEAHAMLLAIGLQESRFDERVQIGGPAHGYWQFEKNGGTKGVLTHAGTRPVVLPLLEMLNYRPVVAECYNALTHNDTLACVFARLLLWTVPGRLPKAIEVEIAWQQYLIGWQPGRPHRETWNQFYLEAWRTVLEE